MKRFSLKLKLTAMYSFFMVLVTCLCLAVLFSLSGNEILTSAQMHLRERVQESADEIELEDGEFEIDSDFYSLDNNVYLALYDKVETSYMERFRRDWNRLRNSRMERFRR